MNPLRKSIELWVEPIAGDKIRSQSKCAIARTIRESDEDIIAINVVRRETKKGPIKWIAFTLRSTGMRYYYHMPDEALEFIRLFDAGEQPNGFSLVLKPSMIFYKYRTMFGLGNGIIREGPPITRGPRTRSLPIAS